MLYWIMFYYTVFLFTIPRVSLLKSCESIPRETLLLLLLCIPNHSEQSYSAFF
uniref:Uncharacterized protein n=1 Tax=Anguilla anguilla TaxID=7936 RepID=A0A0E9QWI5_ANGAN